MITFKEIELKDKALFQKYFKESHSQQCDFNFGIMYLWQKEWDYRFAIVEDHLVIKGYQDGRTLFFMPLGEGDLRKTVNAILAYMEEQGGQFLFVCLEEAHKQRLEEAFPGLFTFENSEEDYDYICLARKLSTYSGRALRGKKRPCNHFEKNFSSWSFEEMKPEYYEECLRLLQLWQRQNPDKVDPEAQSEAEGIRTALPLMEQLDLYGGVLLAQDRIVAFTLGSVSREDTFDCFYEKADLTVDGAYAMVCREFTRKVMEKYPKVKYINREEDMGLDYLRKAKSMSDPEYLLVKYIAYLKT